MLSDCGSCGSDRLVEVELARTLMNCVIEAMALRSRLKTGMLIMSAVEESSRKRGEERRGASKEGILNCRSKNTVYYFSYVTCYIFGYSHWRSRSLQKESIQSTEDIDPIHPNPIHPNPLQRPSNPITSLIQRKRVDSLQVLQASTNGDSIDSVGGGSDRAGGVSPINGDGGGSIDGTAAVAR